MKIVINCFNNNRWLSCAYRSQTFCKNPLNASTIRLGVGTVCCMLLLYAVCSCCILSSPFREPNPSLHTFLLFPSGLSRILMGLHL